MIEHKFAIVDYEVVIFYVMRGLKGRNGPG